MYLDRIDSRSRSCRSEKGEGEKKSPVGGGAWNSLWDAIFVPDFQLRNLPPCRLIHPSPFSPGWKQSAKIWGKFVRTFR